MKRTLLSGKTRSQERAFIPRLRGVKSRMSDWANGSSFPSTRSCAGSNRQQRSCKYSASVRSILAGTATKRFFASLMSGQLTLARILQADTREYRDGMNAERITQIPHSRSFILCGARSGLIVSVSTTAEERQRLSATHIALRFCSNCAGTPDVSDRIEDVVTRFLCCAASPEGGLVQ